MTRQKLDLTDRQRRVDDLLEQWAAATGRELAPPGAFVPPDHPTTSPQYRMMVEGMTASKPAQGADRWRGRTSRHSTGVSVRPAQTAYGRDTAVAKQPGLTGPEQAAQIAGRLCTIHNLFWTVLIERQRRIVMARYHDQLYTHREVAAALGLNRHYVGMATIDILELLGRQLFETRKERRKARMPAVLPY